MPNKSMQARRSNTINSAGSMGGLLAIFVIACAEGQRLWPSGTSLIYLAISVPLLLIWIAYLADWKLAERNAGLAIDISIYVLLVASLGIGFRSRPPVTSELASTLLFWAPLVSAWWAWRYRHFPYRLWILLGGFFVVLTWQLASDHERLDEHLILSLLIALVVHYSYRSTPHADTDPNTILRDSLTGLPSPECFEAELAHVSAISDRYRFPLALIGCRFVTDEDDALFDPQLRQYAEALGDRLRTSDTACHWDRRTIMILLPNTTGSMAHIVADGIRQALSNFDFGQKFRLPPRPAVASMFVDIRIVEHALGEDPMSTLSALENKLAKSAE